MPTMPSRHDCEKQKECSNSKLHMAPGSELDQLRNPTERTGVGGCKTVEKKNAYSAVRIAPGSETEKIETTSIVGLELYGSVEKKNVSPRVRMAPGSVETIDGEHTNHEPRDEKQEEIQPGPGAIFVDGDGYIQNHDQEESFDLETNGENQSHIANDEQFILTLAGSLVETTSVAESAQPGDKPLVATKRNAIFLVVFLSTIAGAVVATVFALSSRKKTPPSILATPNPTYSQVPSQAPTATYSAMPSMIPTTFRRSQVQQSAGEELDFSSDDEGMKWILNRDTWLPPDDAFDPQGLWRDRYGLAAFYLSITSGSYWIEQRPWLTEYSVCTWVWVQCDENGLVSAVNMRDKYIAGSVPSLAFVGMSSLRRLDLASNALSGQIPKLPVNIEYCNLGKNQFSGTLPADHWASLNQLTFLDLQQNALEGSIPNGGFTNLTGLSYLRLSWNSLVGSIPQVPSSIEKYYLNNNNLSGSIPGDYFTSLTQLVDLDFESNKLTGTIPPLPHNLFCTFDYNCFSDTINAIMCIWWEDGAASDCIVQEGA